MIFIILDKVWNSRSILIYFLKQTSILIEGNKGCIYSKQLNNPISSYISLQIIFSKLNSTSCK